MHKNSKIFLKLTENPDLYVAAVRHHFIPRHSVHISAALAGKLSDFQFKKITQEFDHMYGKLAH